MQEVKMCYANKLFLYMYTGFLNEQSEKYESHGDNI